MLEQVQLLLIFWSATSMTGIYKIESQFKPERIYVGSAVNITERWRHHLNELKLTKHHSLKLQRHYNKYGQSDLLFSIIIECEKEDLITIEQSFLDSYKPYFNTCKIAGNTLGVKYSEESKQKMRRPKSEEHKEKLRKSRLGKKATDSTKKKMSDSQKLVINRNKGKKYGPQSKEHRDKIGAARKAAYKRNAIV